METTMIIFRCKECGKEFKGRDEYEAEVAFSQHDDDCPYLSELEKEYKNKQPQHFDPEIKG
jgi:DNA-directed RNA polymerase subunit RPC12/RpoP